MTSREKKEALRRYRELNGHTTESFLFYIFAHHEREDTKKMIHFKFLRHDVYLCGRCTFKYLAILIIIPIMFLTGYTSQVLYDNPLLFFFNFFFFPIIGCIAWLYQFLSNNDNSKVIRYSTGFMIGFSEAFGISCIIWFDLFLILLYIFVFFLYIGIVGLVVLKYGGLDKFQHRSK